MINPQETNLLIILSETMADAVARAAASTVLVNARPRLGASGVCISPDLVLTSNHAVERDRDISVVLPDGSEVSARLSGRDPASDLALLRLASPSGVPAERAAAEARIGQLVLAVGRPGPDGIQASQGIISAVGGPLGTSTGGLLERYLRSDAIPYPGFSGGPLIDLAGQVVGINTTGILNGASFTIPADQAWKIAELLNRQGRVSRGYLGVRTQPVELPKAWQDRLGRKQGTGLLLVTVESGSPAAQGGLIMGDILVGLDGSPVEAHEILLTRLNGGTPGRAASFEILRGGELRLLSVTIGERQ